MYIQQCILVDFFFDKGRGSVHIKIHLLIYMSCTLDWIGLDWMAFLLFCWWVLMLQQLHVFLQFVDCFFGEVFVVYISLIWETKQKQIRKPASEMLGESPSHSFVRNSKFPVLTP
jgi:hypothetical protein